MQTKAPFQLEVKFFVIERDDAFSLARLFGPDERRSAALQWQDGERPGGKEMLFRAAVMIALMRHGRDDTGLSIVPSVGGDAGVLADRRTRPVGANQQAR